MSAHGPVAYNPFVSFVLPTLNSIMHLPKAIAAVQAQRYPHYELVVQDGGSTDGTLGYLEWLRDHSWSDRLRLESEPDSGIGQAYNRGLQRTRGDLVWFLASDEALRPNALERALAWYRRYPDAATIYSGVDVIDDAGNVTTFIPQPFDLLRFMHNEMFPTASGILNRRIIGDDLYYDESLKTCPDYDFWIRLGSRFGRDQLIAVPEVWSESLGTRASMSFRAEAFDQFCRDKLFILNRYLGESLKLPFMPAFRDSVASGIYCWAAESVYGLTGKSDSVTPYFAAAAQLRPGSPRVQALANLLGFVDLDPWTGRIQLSPVGQSRQPFTPLDQASTLLLDLDTIHVSDGWDGASYVRQADSVEITSARPRWGYSALLPFDIKVDEDSWFWMRVSIKVTQGELGIGILCHDSGGKDLLLDEQFVSGQFGAHDVWIRLSEAITHDIRGIMIRNTATSGQSIAQIREVMVVTVAREAEQHAFERSRTDRIEALTGPAKSV